MGFNLNAQDTSNYTGTPGNYRIDYYDSILKFNSKDYCWRREEFYNDTLFSIEFLATDKFNPIKTYTGYYPDGKISFLRTYNYDGEYSELHGIKQLRFKNGNLKQTGLYHHGVKYGNWITYNAYGSRKIWSQYDTPIVDTLSNSKFLKSFPDKISADTITIDSDSSFYDYFPCVSFGKNGIEVIYENNKPSEVRIFQYGSLIYRTQKKMKMKKMIRKSKILPDVKLCGHVHENATNTN